LMGGFIFSCQYFLLLSKMPHCGLNFGIGFLKKNFFIRSIIFLSFFGGEGRCLSFDFDKKRIFCVRASKSFIYFCIYYYYFFIIISCFVARVAPRAIRRTRRPSFRSTRCRWRARRCTSCTGWSASVSAWSR
jgi:hypothetical protein